MFTDKLMMNDIKADFSVSCVSQTDRYCPC